MNQSEKVIRMLEDANKGKLDYRNRLWLHKKVAKLNIRVSEFEDYPIIVNKYDIGETWGKLGRILVQNGQEVTARTAFHPEREALLLRKSILKGYYVYLFPGKTRSG